MKHRLFVNDIQLHTVLLNIEAICHCYLNIAELYKDFYDMF